jgi:hypothetical protein
MRAMGASRDTFMSREMEPTRSFGSTSPFNMLVTAASLVLSFGQSASSSSNINKYLRDAWDDVFHP